MSSNIVILGAGIAGVQAATTLSQAGFKPLLITDEEFAPYYRMRLEEVVTGAEPESIYIHPYSWYEEKGISLVRGKVVALDREKHSVTLSNGTVYEYYKLIISSGANAIVFPLSGAEGKVVALRNMKDAIDLRERLKNINNLTVIGGGLLGLEVATSIAEHFKISVNVVEGQSYILSKQLDEESSAVLKHELNKRGLKILEGVSAVSYSEGNLILSDNTEIATDLILLSVGVKPSYSFIKNSNLLVNRGIVVDASLKTQDEDVYAIGDCAELNGICFSLAMYAREQGIFVANEIISGDSKYVPTEQSSLLKIAGIDIRFFGSRIGNKVVYQKDNSRVTCFIENGILKGIILINAKGLMQKAKAGIEKQFDSETFRL